MFIFSSYGIVGADSVILNILILIVGGICITLEAMLPNGNDSQFIQSKDERFAS